jgi:hypothetical protein
MINSRLEHNSREGDGHYKTDGAFYVQSCQFSLVKISGDMKPSTNERKRNKRKTTIYIIK